MSERRKTGTVILTAALVAAAVLLRLLCRDYVSGDFTDYVGRWISFFRENGRWAALKEPIGDYNVMYQYILILISYFRGSGLYLVKLVSVAFDFVLAAGCAACLKAMGTDALRRRLCFCAVLLMPTVVLNGAFWGQCDSVYTALAVWSVCFLMREKNYASMAFLALAFSFKLQTVFVMPVFFMALICRRLRLREIFVFPAVLLLTCLPAVLCGKPLADIIGVYLRQTGEYPLMSMNAPTLARLLRLSDYSPVAEKLLILLAGALVLAAAFGFRKKFTPRAVPELCLMFSLGVPFLLPHMHERYFYFAAAFGLICAFGAGLRYLPALIFAEAASLICYLRYFGYITGHGSVVTAYLCGCTAVSLFMLAALAVSVFGLLRLKPMPRTFGAVGAVLAGFLLTVICSVGKPAVFIDGRPVSFETLQPTVDGGDIMIPLQNLVAAWGGNIAYDSETGRVVIEKDGFEAGLVFGSATAELNGRPVELSREFEPSPVTCLPDRDVESLLGLRRERDGVVLRFYEE